MVGKKYTAEDKERIIQEYQLAYENANPGRRIRVKEKSRGWYTLVGPYGARGSHRIGALVEMTERLNSRAKWVVEG